jgi:hypothetical protein
MTPLAFSEVMEDILEKLRLSLALVIKNAFAL